MSRWAVPDARFAVPAQKPQRVPCSQAEEAGWQNFMGRKAQGPVSLEVRRPGQETDDGDWTSPERIVRDSERCSSR